MKAEKRKREKDQKLASKNNIKNSTKTENMGNEEKNLAIELGTAIKEEIKKAREDIKEASEKISALEEMAAIQKELLYKNNKSEKKYSLKYHINSMIKNAIEIVKTPKIYSQIEEMNEESKENSTSKLEEILIEIYPHMPKQIYDQKESIEHPILTREKINLKEKIIDYINKNEPRIDQKKTDYVERLSEDLVISLAYGRETAITMLINNAERVYPNTQKTEKTEKTLNKIKEKYGCID